MPFLVATIFRVLDRRLSKPFNGFVAAPGNAFTCVVAISHTKLSLCIALLRSLVLPSPCSAFIMHSACQAFASGRSGRAVRLEPGDIAGNDALSFDYKDGVVQFSSWQDNSWGARHQIRNEISGSKGTLLTDFGGIV